MNIKQAGSLSLLETIEEARKSGALDERASTASQQVRAEANGEFLVALGVNGDMTHHQQQFVEAFEKRKRGGGTEGKGYGFSIPTEGRKPNLR